MSPRSATDGRFKEQPEQGDRSKPFIPPSAATAKYMRMPYDGAMLTYVLAKIPHPTSRPAATQAPP